MTTSLLQNTSARLSSKTHFFSTLLAILFGVLVFGSSAQAKTKTAPPNELNYKDFGQLRDTSSLRLSPNGDKVASINRVDVPGSKGSAVQVTDLKTGKSEIVLFTDNSKYFLNYIDWKDNTSLLVFTYYPSESPTYLGHTRIREATRELRLMIIDTETKKIHTPFKKSFLKKYDVLPTNLADVISYLPNDPDHLLMSVPAHSIWEGWNTLRKVNFKKQTSSIIQESKDHVYAWRVDRQKNLRIGAWIHDGKVKILHKKIDKNKWDVLWEFDRFSENQVWPMGFDHDPNILYVNAYENNYKKLYRVNLEDEKLTKELVLGYQDRDVEGYLLYSEKKQRVIGLSHAADEGSIFFDEKLQALQDGINKAIPQANNYITSLSDDLSKFILYSSGPQESGTFFLGERNPTKLNAISYARKKLIPQAMSPVKEYEYKARDGLDIQAWLTLPANKEAKNLPAIMFPHGGPYARDGNAFDYWAQFFSNKGYAVLQMNFRGSTGQGLNFFKEGFKTWGKEMQDDIQDGALALIKDGVIDKNRICIAGASYGGYAALMGVVKTPDFYQCAISIAGVSDLYKLIIDNRSAYSRWNMVDELIGRDRGELKKVSPLDRAEEIKVPILLVHGNMDMQVEVEHSQLMFKKLQSLKKTVEYIELPAEDHYLSNEDNRVATFKAMNDFLDQYLPAN